MPTRPQLTAPMEASTKALELINEHADLLEEHWDLFNIIFLPDLDLNFK